MEIDKIYLGDCLELMKEIPDRSIDLVLTDPPYLFKKGGQSGKNKVGGSMSKHGEITTNFSNFGKESIETMLIRCERLFRKGFNGYFFCSEMQLVHYLSFAYNKRLNYNVLIWDRKDKKMLSRLYYRSCIDYIVRIYGSGHSLNRLNERYDFYSKLISVRQPYTSGHPTEKPIPIIQRFIRLSTNENNVVLDPFIGSGTTAVACIKEKRHFIGMELDKEYYDIACRRVKDELSNQTLF